MKNDEYSRVFASIFSLIFPEIRSSQRYTAADPRALQKTRACYYSTAIPQLNICQFGIFFISEQGDHSARGGAKSCPEKMGRAAAADHNLYNLAETTWSYLLLDKFFYFTVVTGSVFCVQRFYLDILLHCISQCMWWLFVYIFTINYAVLAAHDLNHFTEPDFFELSIRAGYASFFSHHRVIRKAFSGGKINSQLNLLSFPHYPIQPYNWRGATLLVQSSFLPVV